MAALTGLFIADSYKALLKTVDNDVLGAAAKEIVDGYGNVSGVLFDTSGNVTINGNFRALDAILDSSGNAGTAGQVLTTTGTTTQWQSLSSVSGVTGSGTAGYLPLWSTNSALTNSIAIQSGATITIGGTLTATTKINTPILQLTGGVGSQGTLSWNADEETVDLVQNGTTTPLNQATELHVKNQTGATIAKGTPVRAAGTLGASGRILIAPMIANGTIEAKYFLGVTNEAIADGEEGKVITFGKIRSLNTAAYTEGQTLWVSSTVAGAFTTTRPVAPNLDLEVAIVINSHVNNGTIFVRATNGHYLGTAHDVNISSVAENDLLVYNTNRWVNTKTIGDLTAANVTLSGYLRGPATFVIDPAAYGDETGLVQILGDLRVDGTTTTINSTTISVSDKNITLAKDAVTAGDANGAGITIAGPNATLTYLSATDDFTFNKNVNASRFVGPLTGDVTGTVSTISNHDTDDLDEGTTNLYFTTTRARDSFSAGTGVAINAGEISIGQSVGTTDNVTFGVVTASLSGNATTASALSTARNIALDGSVTGNADFDGSGNITITTTTNHNHDDRYYTETESDNRFVNVSGDTMTGNLNWGATDQGLTWAMNTDGAYIKFFNAGDGDTNSRLEYATSDNGNEYHRFMISGTERMKITETGITATGYNKTNWDAAYSYSQIGHLPLTGGTLTGDLTLDDKLTITGTTNNFVIDEEADGTWHLYDTFQDNGIVLYSGSGGMDFQYNGVTEMTIDGSGVSFTGTINLDAADLNIGSADIIFGTTAGGATRGLIWDVSGSGNLSKLIGGGADGGKVTLFANMDDAITTGNIFEIKDGSTGSLFLGLSHAGILTAGGGTSTLWNTAYNYSQVGHLPLAGGTITGNLTIDKNTPRIDFSANVNSGVVGGRIELNENGNLWVNARGGSSLWLNWVAPTNQTSNSNLYVGNGNEGNSILTVIGSTNRVGINKMIPTEALDVVGNVVISGTLSASGYNSANWDTAYGWGDHAGLYLRVSPDANTPYNGNFAIGDNGTTNFIQSHNSQPLEINPLGNAVTINNQAAIHAGNIGNQSVAYAANAGLLDSIDSTSFLRSDVNDYASGKVFFTHHTNSEPFAAVEINGGTTHTGLYINPSASSQAHVRFGTNGTLKWQIRAPFQDGADADLQIYSWVGADDMFRFKHTGVMHFKKSSSTIISTGGGSDAFGYNTSYGHYIQGTGSRYIYGDGIYYDGAVARTLIHSGNIAAQSVASAGNADTLDSLDSSQFLRSDQSDTMTGTLTVGSSGIASSFTSGAGGYSSIRFLSTGGGAVGSLTTISNRIWIGSENSGGTGSNGEIQIEPTAGNVLYLKSGGNVGIGTDSPGAKLEISSGATLPIIRARYNGSYYTDYDSNGIKVVGPSQTFSITDNGSTAFHIASGGNIAIGNTEASGRLDVHQNTSGTMLARFWNTNTSGTGAMALRIANSSNNNNGGRIEFSDNDYYVATISADRNQGIVFRTSATGSDPVAIAERFRIAAGGYIGINETNPTAPMVLSTPGNTVDGTFYSTFTIKNTGATSFSRIRFDRGSVAKWGLTHHQDDSFRISNLYKNGAVDADDTAFTIKNNSYIGIGTDSPAAKLHVVGSVGGGGIVQLTDSTAESSIAYKINGGTGSVGWVTGNYNNDFFMYSYTNGSQVMTLKPSGYVGFGVTNPTAKVDTGGVRIGRDFSISGRSTVRIDSLDSSKPADILFGHTGAANQTSWTGVYWSLSSRAAENGNRFTIWRGNGQPAPYNSEAILLSLEPSGDLGIGVTDPAYRLDVAGTIRATGDVIAYSDARVKENVNTIDNALDKVLAMRGVEYNKIGETDQKIGVIAQEVEKILPQVVQDDKNGFKSVAYGNIVGVLIEAIKEQQKQIDELKALLNVSPK